MKIALAQLDMGFEDKGFCHENLRGTHGKSRGKRG